MINTYNESSLHNTLKTLYCQENNGKTEVSLFGHIYDIVANKTVIEIQTGNLSKLLAKTMDTLNHGYKVKVVYPLVINKWIESTDNNGNRLSCRKSPIRNSIYSIFDELTGLYPVLLEKNFSLDIVEINIIEKRTKFEEPVQSKNKRRRFRKNYLKSDKVLKEILGTRTFNSSKDYTSLIPKEILPQFCAKDLSAALKENKNLPSSASRKAHIMLWVLKRMNLVEETTIINRNHYYKVL